MRNDKLDETMITREEDHKHIHLECKEKTPFFQEGTFNLPIKETLTLAEPVAMTNFTPEHNSSAKARGYTIAPVPRDGLSAYYAVIDQLNKILNLNIIGLSSAYVQYVHNHQLKKIAEHLRKLVSDHIIKNSDHYIRYISQHSSVDPHLKNMVSLMTFLFTKELAEQKTSAPHHELELNVLANVLNIRMVILEEKTPRILNNRSDTVTTAWISQNQQEYGSLQPINNESAQLSRQHWLQKIDKQLQHPEKKFAPGTFSLPIQEMLTFEEKNTNISVDPTLYLFPDIQKDFQKFKDDLIRLFKYFSFQNSPVFKDITEAQSKYQLVRIIEKFLACRKLLFPEKTALTLKLERLLESHKTEEKEDPILMRENLLTSAPDLSLVRFATQYPPFFPLPMTFPMPILAGNPSPTPSTPGRLSRLPQKKLKASLLRGKSGKFKCEVQGCDKCFDKKSILNRHNKTHTRTNKKEFCCNVPGCDRGYSTKENLRNHQRKAHKNVRFCCNVPGCSKNYSEKYSLRKHEINIHNLSPVSTPASIAALTTSAEIKLPSTRAIAPVITQTESPRLTERAPATAHPSHPHESQISSITEMIKSMLLPILSNPALISAQHESEIASLSQMEREMLVLLPSSPKQRESLASLVTESLRSMLSPIFSMPPPSDPAQRKSQIFSVTEVVQNMIYSTPSAPDSNLESKRSASLSDGGSIIEAPTCGR